MSVIEKLPDHDPRALRGFALIAVREGDADTARVLRAAADRIEELTINPLAGDLVDRWAMKLAVGNNGGKWDSHYTEKHKELWRKRAREFIEECRL